MPQLSAALRRSWVFCLPSAFESFGVPYLEAVAHGVTILATPTSVLSVLSEMGVAVARGG
jgi:glycosyltransferase involved in cell wall biosynthesis